jgi:nucleoside-diphosphate-sugar epimerase
MLDFLTYHSTDMTNIGLVLITGATGLVGSRVLLEALVKGYPVRLAVRGRYRIEQLQKIPILQPYASSIEFAIIPDMSVESAFDDAVKGARYIIHIASPLPKPSSDLKATIVQPAVTMSLNILQSAQKEQGVEKIVLTSSVAAVSPSTPKPFTADNIEPDPQGAYQHPLLTYADSKKLAHNHVRRFVDEKQPQYSVISIMPTFVVGKNLFATSTDELTAGSNSVALAPILGIEISEPMPGYVCHVDDVAFVHVAALDSKVKGYLNFGVNYNGANGVIWDDAIEIVQRHFAEQVRSGVFSLNGSVTTQKLLFDASRTEEYFGIKFKSFEEMVVDVVQQFIEIANQWTSE